MMEIRYNVASSLDGFIAPPDETFGWIVEDPTIDFEALYASYDYFIMGRKTYEIIASDPNSPLKKAVDSRSKKNVIVISRTLDPKKFPDMTVLDGGYIDHIKELKKGGGRMWVMGGGWLAAECMEARLLDGMDVAIMPRLLSTGFKLVIEGNQGGIYKLALRSLEKLDSGIVMTQYDVMYKD